MIIIFGNNNLFEKCILGPGLQLFAAIAFLAAVQRGYPIILPEYEPPGFVKGGLHGKLVMLKG